VEVPTLPEQQRIVAILDKAFAAIEQTKANTIQNLKNAKELFASYLNNIFIIQKLDALSTETKQLEIIYQQKITELDNLKKSILQKAFNGELGIK
jgi:restriction endonuclease S subunit